MKRLALILPATVLAVLLTAPAAIGFGLKAVDVQILDEHGEPALEAGTHPFAVKESFEVEREISPEVGEIPAGQLREASGTLPPGLIGSPFAVPQCEGVDFATVIEVEGIEGPDCSNSSVLGIVRIAATVDDGSDAVLETPVYNLVPPPGVAAKIGFRPFAASPVTIDVGIEDTPPYRATFASTNVTQTARVLGTEVTLWGNPTASSHDAQRGRCAFFLEHPKGVKVRPPASTCPVESGDSIPFLTLPRSCTGPLAFGFHALSWQGDTFDTAFTLGPGMGGCDKLLFGPTISSKPTAASAESPSGLDFGLDVEDPGIANPDGTARSDLKKAVITLPEGMTVNPSQAEGLAVCSQADFAREKAASAFGEGCPGASKIGTVEAETPLLKNKVLKGSLFVATPYENPFGTLIALYMVFKEPGLGLGVKFAGKVTPDPHTGQLVVSFGEPGQELIQAPISHVRVHLREGGRSPLITPPTCGAYTTTAELTPWADPAHPYTTSDSFKIASGVGGGPCPAGGQPFEPGFAAGTLNNAAGSYSPFFTRITRRDGDQDLTKVSALLPPGVSARLAGVAQCSAPAIAAAKAKSGRAELASPSCPLGSLIGTATAGAGVGSELTYVKGRVYLAGPYNGAPISIVEIVPALAGPFDVGTVVVRQALDIDPRTGQASVDGDRSDPIPHILAGIPLRVRDVRVNVERSGFTLNPTGCDRSRVAARLWGGGQNPFSSADDAPVARQAPFQVAGCQALGFAPRLSLRLRGGTRRGAFPALHLLFRPRAGDANLERLSLRFPHSEFIEQGHFRTICTRVQFAAGAGHGSQCPANSVYGHAKVYTPLLDEPLTGPVFLRSSNHSLPDVVLALTGPPSLRVHVEVPARIDSVHGGLRAIASGTPDVPVSKAIVDMQGGQKGLFVNSTDICARSHRANVGLLGQNGKTAALRTLLRARCGHRHRPH